MKCTGYKYNYFKRQIAFPSIAFDFCISESFLYVAIL